MSLNSYDNLKISVANFLARKDLDASIPDFISLAESRLNNNADFRVKGMVCKLVATVSGTELGLPTDYLGMRNFRIESGAEITQVSPKVMQSMKRNYCEGQYYLDLGNRIELFPEADDLTVEIFYYQRIPALSDTNQINWLLSQAPDVYLYGALQEGVQFMKNDDRVGLWATRYQEAVDNVISADVSDRWSGLQTVSLL